jgi:hypothetical protein
MLALWTGHFSGICTCKLEEEEDDQHPERDDRCSRKKQEPVRRDELHSRNEQESEQIDGRPSKNKQELVEKGGCQCAHPCLLA